MLLKDTYFRPKDKYRLKGWKKIFHINGNKKSRIAILLSDERLYNNDKWMKSTRGFTIVNISVANTGAPKYVNQLLPDI